MFASHWSGKIEYMFADYEKQNYLGDIIPPALISARPSTRSKLASIITSVARRSADIDQLALLKTERAGLALALF